MTNNGIGIAANFATAIIGHVVVHKNTVGVLFGRGGGTVVDTIVSNNSQFGIEVSEGSLLLGHSTITGNGTGIGIGPPTGDLATSSGDNLIYFNGTNVSGTLAKVGTQ